MLSMGRHEIIELLYFTVKNTDQTLQTATHWKFYQEVGSCEARAMISVCLLEILLNTLPEFLLIVNSVQIFVKGDLLCVCVCVYICFGGFFFVYVLGGVPPSSFSFDYS